MIYNNISITIRTQFSLLLFKMWSHYTCETLKILIYFLVD